VSRAIVLLSGGLDSTTTLAYAKNVGHECYALTFDYGQRHRDELAAAAQVARRYEVARHRVARVDLAALGGSSLTDATRPVPRPDGVEQIGDAIPDTYVPARNTVFLAYAVAYAEVTGAVDIFIGVNALDYSGYPDCRPEYIAAFEAMANLATRAGVDGRRLRIQAPLLHLDKAEVIRLGTTLGVDYGATHSCYDPAGGRPCGGCEACLLRARGFANAGLSDPAVAR